MKRKTLCSVILVTSMALMAFIPARAQQAIRINLEDGTSIEVAIIEIQKITFDLVNAMQQRPELAKQLLKLMAFPNPANTAVTLDYSLPEEGEVTIELYNLYGNMIESFSQGIQQAGDHRYRLSTRRRASGAYIVRVMQNEAFVTQKIIVKH